MTNDTTVLTLEKRTIVGKKVKHLRREGSVPGVVYGHGLEPVAIQAPLLALQKVIRQVGKHHPVSIELDGKKRIALIKSMSTDPVKNNLRHIAFHAVKQNEKVTTNIPVVLDGMGESPAEKAGFVILSTLDELAVKALPADLPEALHVSTRSLSEAGQHLTVGDIKLAKGVEIDADAELVVASVYEPSALQAANEAAGGDAEEATAPEAENSETEPTKEA